MCLFVEYTSSPLRGLCPKILISNEHLPSKINIILQDMEEKSDIKQPVYVEIMHFVPDLERENEGQYRLYKGLVKKIDVTVGKIFIDDIVMEL